MVSGSRASTMIAESARLRKESAGRSIRIAPSMTRIMMSERSVATSEPENTQYAVAPIIATMAAILLQGQCSAA
jgi:hypothetical protein